MLTQHIENYIGYEITLSVNSYACEALKLRGYRGELEIKRAIRAEVKKREPLATEVGDYRIATVYMSPDGSYRTTVSRGGWILERYASRSRAAALKLQKSLVATYEAREMGNGD